MAVIKPYALANGDRRYYVQYRTPDRKQTKKRGFTTKKAAQKFASEIELAKDAGTFVNPAAGKTTVATVYEEWAPGQDLLAPRTKRTNLSAYNVHVRDKWGEWPVNRISAPDVRNWVVEMQNNGKGRDTINRALHVLRSILDVAVETRKITANPVQKITVKREVKARRPYLTVDQVEMLATVENDTELEALIFTLAYCGLRISELAALDVADFEQSTGRLNVSKAIRNYGEIGPTKTYEQRRVPVPRFLAVKLNQITTGRPASSPLFRSPTGARIDVDNFRDRVFKPAVKAARDEWIKTHDTDFPDLRPHGLRHTCASLAIRTGANVKAVQGLLGHESAAVTLNVYADLFPDDLERLGDALDELRRNAQ